MFFCSCHSFATLCFLTMEMVNIHADLRHVFKPPESGGTLESSVDRGFFLHACSSSCDTLFFCCSRFLFILRFESYFSDVRWCKNLVVSWYARPSLVTVRHRVSQSRADRWQRLGSQFASLVHHPWSFSQVLRDVGISRLSMFLSHPSTLSVWNRWKHHLIFEKTIYILGHKYSSWSGLIHWWFGGLLGWPVVCLEFIRKATGKAQSRSPSPSPKKNANPKPSGPSAGPALRAPDKKFHLTCSHWDKKFLRN